MRPVDPPRTETQQPQGTQPPVAQGPAQSPLSGFQIPFSLQKYVSGDNAQIVRNHLDDVPADERQAYLNELGAVVAAAEASKINAVEAINAYMTAKSERYKQAAVKRAEKWKTLKLVGEITTGGLFLVAIFSLVLVLLAIERNTRSLRRSSGLALRSEEQEVISA